MDHCIQPYTKLLPFIQFKPIIKSLNKMATAINWPAKYLPGTTDNFVSNELIVTGLTAEEVWPHLVDPTQWETYYDNASQVTPPSPGPQLKKGDTFSFSTFGFPPLRSQCLESIPPTKTTPGRLGWSASQEGDEDSAMDVYHAWIVEDLSGGRVRILTQESQIGKPAVELKGQKPNPMLNKHQDWVEGLLKKAAEVKGKK